MTSLKPKEYKAEYLKDLDTTPFTPTEIAGINIPQLQQDISIQT